jgi:hypothetical protein
MTAAAASFGCEETMNPADSEPPHGQLKASAVDAFFFWQQPALPGDPIPMSRLQHPHEELLPLCPQQHVFPSARLTRVLVAALAGFWGTTGQPMLPTTNTNSVTSAVKRLRNIGRRLTGRGMPESYTGLSRDCNLR